MRTTLPSPTAAKAASKEPQLLRFGLRQLLLFVALASVLLTLLVTTRGPWPLVVAACAVMIGGHLLGAMLGTRLRDTSREVRQWRRTHPGLDADEPRTTAEPVNLDEINLPPSTPLAEPAKLSPMRPWFVFAGGVVGAVLGAVSFAVTPVFWSNPAGLAVIVISTAVLGAWTVFLASSFGSTAHHAWQHAHKNKVPQIVFTAEDAESAEEN